MNSEQKSNQDKPTMKLVLPGGELPTWAEIRALSNERIIISDKKLEKVLNHDSVVVKSGKTYTKIKGETIFIDIYYLLPENVRQSFKYSVEIEYLKELIDFVFRTNELVRFVEGYNVHYWMIPQAKAIKLATRTYDNSELDVYFETRLAELIEYLVHKDYLKDAKKQFLKELGTKEQKTVVKQENGITIISAKKKHWWNKRK